ncbi:WxL domain-containing protein [Aquihabitans sp. McL0605]|uniref:WxL domain-containing protein n=1 Tax=Aquihabitans sp. McL0605 TaxID=3415671 RepID=UPI003CEF83F4
MSKSATRTRRARLAGVAAFAVATATLVSSPSGAVTNPNPGNPPVTQSDIVHTACNNTFQPTKFSLDYKIDSTITSPLSGGNTSAIYPGDTFGVSFKATAEVSASFLNGAYALIGPQAITILNDQVTIAPLYGATGSPVTITDTTDIPLPQPGDVRTVGFTSGSTQITGTFTAADVGANVYDSGDGFTTAATIVSQTGSTAQLSLAATATGSDPVRIWQFLTSDIPLVIGTQAGSFTADPGITAPYQAKFQILGNSSTTGDPVPLGNGNTGIGFGGGIINPSAHQTEIKASLGPGITPSLVCMGGSWTATTSGTPPTTAYDLPFTAPDTATGAGGFGAIDVTALPIPTATVTSITGIGGAPAQFVTTAARSGNTINFGGGNWTPGGTPTVQLCDSAGTNCDASGLSGVSASIDGSGQLTGAATVDASATQGANRRLTVTAGSESDHRASLLILGTPTIALSAGSGPANGAVNVTGTNWNPGSGATTVVVAADGTGNPLAAPVNVVINGSGALTGTVTTPAGTALIALADGNPAYPQPPSPLNPGSLAAVAPFSINQNAQSCGSGSPLAGCTLNQSLYLNIQPGDFTWSQLTPFVVLNSTTTGNACTEANKTTCYGMKLDGSTQTVNGNINQISITDARGAGAGWDVSATMTDLVTGAGGVNEVLPASSVHLTPACAVTDGNTAGGTAAVTAGAAGVLSTSTALGLCSAAPTHGGGKFTVDGALTMSVPPSTNAGLYQATLTLTAV